MTTVIVALLVVVAALVAVTLVLRARWQLESSKDVWVELLARNVSRPRSAKALRAAFVEAITAQQHTSLSGEPAALPAMLVRISPEDAMRLHPAGDVDALGREASDLYLQHAQRSGWRIDGLPRVRVRADGRLRPGWIPAPQRSTADPGSPPSQMPGPVRRAPSPPPTRPNPDDQATSVIPPVGGRPDATELIAPAKPAGPDLVIEYAGRSYDIRGHILGLGRKHNNYFALEERTASFKHALLERTDTGWTVRDLGSTNGSLIDGRKLGPEPVPIAQRADLSLGGAQLTVRIPG